MISVNTNAGASQALQALGAIDAAIATNQNHLSTGLRIASAKDDGATYAITTRQRSASKSLSTVNESLARGKSAVDTAMEVGTQIVDLLQHMKELALTGTEATIDQTTRTTIENEYDDTMGRAIKLFNSASFDGVNLLTSSGTTSFLASVDGTETVDVQGMNVYFNPWAPGPTFQMRGYSLDQVVYAKNCLNDTTKSIAAFTKALAKLGTASQAIDRQMSFNSKLQDTIDAGVGNLVDADMAKESAISESLKTKQQLAVQALAISNQAPTTLLSLFK